MSPVSVGGLGISALKIRRLDGKERRNVGGEVGLGSGMALMLELARSSDVEEGPVGVKGVHN